MSKVSGSNHIVLIPTNIPVIKKGNYIESLTNQNANELKKLASSLVIKGRPKSDSE